MLRSVSLPRPFDSEKYLSRKKLLERRKKKSPMSQKGWEMSEEEEEEEEMCDVTGEAEIKMETPEDFPVGEEFSAGDESMPAGSSDFMGEVEHPPPGSGEFPAGEESLPLETSGEQIGDTTNDGNAEEDENENPFAGDESEDEVEVTIGEIRQNVPFTTKSDPRSVMVASSAGKIDIDPSPMADGVVIYDVDLASLDEKPWRKPGADPSDYFNYGFTEETWNLYCERQKKLRAEFGGKQSAINRFITNSISITNPLAPISSRQVPTIGGEVNKILVEGSEFRQNGRDRGNRSSDGQNNVIRTVITASTPSNIPTLSASVPDFSRPPPMMMPTLTSSSTESSSEPPIPGSESAMVSNPIQTSVGMNVPTAVSSSSVGTPELQPNPIITTPQGIPTIGATINTSLPPPGFNFAMPPPNLRPPPPASMSIPPPTFNPMMPPPNFAQPPPFARPMPPRMVPPPGISRLPPLLPQEEFNDLNVMGRRRESNEYSGGSGEKKERRERERDERRERDRGKSSGESEGEEEQHRRSRHRKRSRTPLKRKVKHDVDSVGRRSGKEREERRGGGERDRERDSKSAHRSRHRSISVESRRRRDDRKRRDDEGDKKKRRHEKSDDRSDRKRSKRTAPAEEQASAADERGSAAETVVKVEVEEPAEE